jgi:dephospho-CoA kinase
LNAAQNGSQFVLALTGPIAAGKNAASDILQKRGFACIDDDKLVHQIIDEKRASILEAFGGMAKEKGIQLLKDNVIDRAALGSLLFNNPRALAAQEAIVHPAVSQKNEAFLLAHQNQPCAINATVLYKTPRILTRCACVLYIDAPKITRFLRIKQRNRFSNAHIRQRIRSQSGLFSQYKSVCADIHRVWNIGDLNALERKIDGFLKLCEKRGYQIWNKNEFYG